MGFLGKLFRPRDQGRSIGDLVIKFSDDNEKVAIRTSVTLDFFDWTWLYLLHLAGTLHHFSDDVNAPMLLGVVDAFAQDILQNKLTYYLFSEEVTGPISTHDPLTDDVKVVPDIPGGVTFAINLLLSPDGVPILQTDPPPNATVGQLALSNLAFLHHVLGMIRAVGESKQDPVERRVTQGEFHKSLAVFIAGFVKFYANHPGAYKELSSTIEAPKAAMAIRGPNNRAKQ